MEKFEKHSVDGIPFNHNHSQSLPEVVGEDFNLGSLEIIGYMQGECISVEPKLTWLHFIRVQKFNETKHPITKKKRTMVLAWTKNNYKAPVLLICKQK